MNRQEALTLWQQHAPMLAERGIVLPNVLSYLPDEFKTNFALAMDAMPGLLGSSSRLLMAQDALPLLATTPSAAIPAMLTTLIDPKVIEILFAANKAAEIFGEVKKGDWVDQTIMFPVVEHTGEVSSYGDFAENGRAGANTNFPQRQAYLFQIMVEYGELEMERADRARLNWVSQLTQAAATMMAKFLNFTYFFGVSGLQNYGLINDPSLSAPLTPGAKAATPGNPKWVVNGVVTATANEIFADIQSMFIALVNQTGGLVDASTPMTLALSPQSEFALTATNTFNVNVHDLLKKNFPNIKIKSAVQYGVTTTQNPQGNASGQLAQLIAENLEGNETGYCAFNEKMRAHKLIPASSSWKQKKTSGSWGAIILRPVSIVQMLGL